MSLINDALKRAKEAQRKETPSGGSPLWPVETNKRTERDFGLVLPVVIFFLVVAAIIFIGLAMARPAAKPPVIKNIAAPAIVPTQEVTTVAPAPNPPTPVLPVSAPLVSAPASSTPLAVVTSPAPVNAEASKPVRIQGIAYGPVHSWAVVNGKTVYVGDVVNGMRVTAILRNSITLAGNGRTNIFTVGQK